MNALYLEIGQRIQHLRHLHKMTQETLAEQLNLSVKHISSVERGLSCLSVEKLIQLCAVLDCTADYLILGKGLPDSDCYIPQSIVSVFRDSDKKKREILEEYLLFFQKLRS